MTSLAKRFGEDPAMWGIAGLLHDIDYEKVQNDLSRHSLLGAEMLEGLGVEPEICQAVKVHNESHGVPPVTLMERALFVCDPITGLIVAAVLVLPSKKIADLSAENILNRFKEKSFARGASRAIIQKCEEFLDLDLESFTKISLGAMQKIASELGL